MLVVSGTQLKGHFWGIYVTGKGMNGSFLPGQEERPVLGLHTSPGTEHSPEAQPVLGTGHPNPIILTLQKNSDFEKTLPF